VSRLNARALMREIAAIAENALAKAPIKRIHPTSRDHCARYRHTDDETK
jgi:hypothetical protein